MMPPPVMQMQVPPPQSDLLQGLLLYPALMVQQTLSNSLFFLILYKVCLIFFLIKKKKEDFMNNSFSVTKLPITKVFLKLYFVFEQQVAFLQLKCSFTIHCREILVKAKHLKKEKQIFKFLHSLKTEILVARESSSCASRQCLGRMRDFEM